MSEIDELRPSSIRPTSLCYETAAAQLQTVTLSVPSINPIYLSIYLQVVPGSIYRLHEVAKELQDKGLPP